MSARRLKNNGFGKMPRYKKRCNTKGAPFKWLLVYYTVFQEEYNDFVTMILPHLRQAPKFCKNVAFDMIHVARTQGGTKALQGNGYTVFSYKPGDRSLRVKKSKCKTIAGCIPKMFAEQRKKYRRNYDGIMYSGHSNGIALGKDEYEAIAAIDLRKLLLSEVKKSRGKKFKVLAFDSCYMGTLASLYEFRRCATHILAAPTYHDGRSLITGLTFFQKDKSVSDYQWLKSVVADYVFNVPRVFVSTYPILTSLLSAKALGRLVDYLIKSGLWKSLKFPRSSIIYHDDSNLCDIDAVFWSTYKTASSQTKTKLRKASALLKKTILYSPYNPENHKARIFPRLSIHRSVPTYVDRDVVCGKTGMSYFNRTGCTLKK